MAESGVTKNEKREKARELARREREKAARRDKLRKWLAPTLVSVAILGVIAIIVTVVVTSGPGPQSAAGPRNMASGGIQFVGEAGELTPVTTSAIPASGAPTDPDSSADDGIADIELYIDLSCPACKAFEDTYNQQIMTLVGSGQATYTVHPVAILDAQFAPSKYSTRANNAAACVADLAPDSFLDVVAAMFANQPQEGTSGLTNREIVNVVKGAGLDDEKVNTCIEDAFFEPFILANTQRATGDEELRSAQGFSTPTLVVDGKVWDRSVDPIEFIQASVG